MRHLVTLLALALVGAGAWLAQNTVHAQPAACPIQVASAFSATNLICTNLRLGEACVGNGTVEASEREGVTDFRFSQIGDKAPLTNIGELRLRSVDTTSALWAVVQAQHNIRTSGGLTNLAAKTLIFGDVTMADDGDVAQEVIGSGDGRFATVLAERGIIIRSQPDAGSAAVWQLQAGERVIAIAQSVDKAWLRVRVPSGFGGVGWVYAYYMDVEGGQESLPFAQANAPRPTPIPPPPPPEYGTMQAFKLISANTDPSCADTPDSGILMQSPDGMLEEMRIRVNGVKMEFNGTIFLQAQAGRELRVSVLEGTVFFLEGDNRTQVDAPRVGTVAMGSNLEPLGVVQVSQLEATPRLLALPSSLLTRTVAFFLGGGSVAQAPAQEPTPMPANVVSGFATATPEGEVASVATEATPEAQPTATPTPSVAGSLVSTQHGELCGRAEPLSITQEAPAFGFSADVGGLWTARAGTSATFEVLGGTFQPNLGDFIRLLSVQGIVAQSGDQQQLSVTFTQDVRFSASFSSKAGDTLIVTVRCNN